MDIRRVPDILKKKYLPLESDNESLLYLILHKDGSGSIYIEDDGSLIGRTAFTFSSMQELIGELSRQYED